jgi:hypothetical protein
MTRRIIAAVLIALGVAAAGAGTAAQASTSQTLYRGSAPAASTLYRG